MIVLIGEYSGVHSCLAEALKCKGHEVTLISDGDAYKNFPNDIAAPIVNHSGLLKYIYLFLYYMGFTGAINYLKLKKRISSIKGVEIVQFINPVAIPSLGAIGNFLLFNYFKKKASVVSLCALGDDYNWVMACLKGEFKYSAMDRLFKRGIKGFLKYFYSLKYIASPMFFILSLYFLKKTNVIIPGLIDYEMAYKKNNKSSNKIPLPINTKDMDHPAQTKYPVKIFHGWQTGKEAKKGNDLLHAAATRCVSHFGPDIVNYEVVGGLPYNDYIEKFNDSDIFLDQVFSYDCGVNALLAMARGKVVFSGFEFLGSKETGVNALPSEDDIYECLSSLILDLDKIDEIKHNAYDHVKNCHDYLLVADQYLKVWQEFRK